MEHDDEARGGTNRRFTDRSGEMDTVVGPGAKMKGKITGKANVEVHGTLEGTCNIEGVLHIKDGGNLIGDVQVNDAIIEGTASGELVVRNKLEIRATGKVEGKLQAKSIAMAEGCIVQGDVDMTGGASTFKEKRG
jgi:cytoskeletal protein CcmA (bactofilin family)